MVTCPEGEFWTRVLLGRLSRPDDDDGYEYQPVVDDDLARQLAAPCPACGAAGACSYDDEGRPMIHADVDDGED